MKPIVKLRKKFPYAFWSHPHWLDNCPAHDDERHSLRFWEKPDLGVDLLCELGCSPAAICSAAGISVLDLVATADELFKIKGQQK